MSRLHGTKQKNQKRKLVDNFHTTLVTGLLIFVGSAEEGLPPTAMLPEGVSAGLILILLQHQYCSEMMDSPATQEPLSVVRLDLFEKL